MKTEMSISRKAFKTEDGQEREYTAYEIEIDGHVFGLKPRAEDKKLIEYLLEQKGVFEKK